MRQYAGEKMPAAMRHHPSAPVGRTRWLYTDLVDETVAEALSRGNLDVWMPGWVP